MRTLSLSTLILFWAVVLFSAIYANAATTATVTATVTAQNVAITVTDGSIAYGTMNIGASASTIASDKNDTQTAVNAGNVTATINIEGQNSSAWTLSGSPGSDQYTHKFCSSSCSTPPTNYTALTTNYQTLNASLAANGSQPFDLQLYTPTTSTSYTQQTVSVTVQAVGP